MPSKVTQPSFEFWYDEKWYTVQGAETMVSIGTKDDMATMRAEYTRMRDVAQKRLHRLEKTFPNAKALQSHPQGFPKLREIDPRDFAKAFADLAKFVRAKGSTVTGQRSIQEKTTRQLNKAIGAEEGQGVNESNYWRVINQLEQARAQKIVYGSDKMVEFADASLSLGLSDDQFDDLIDKLDKIVSHTDELETAMSGYMKETEITDIQSVDIDKFIEMIGW